MSAENLHNTMMPASLVAQRLQAVLEQHLGPFLGDGHQEFEVTMGAIHWIGQHPDADPTHLAVEDFKAAFGFEPHAPKPAPADQQAA